MFFSIPCMKATTIQTLRGGGNVLIVSDTAGRSLELIYLLEQCWSRDNSGFDAYPLVFLSSVAVQVVEFAKSLIEWMSDKLMNTFEASRRNPFDVKRTRLCHSLDELADIASLGPLVVVAAGHDLESGFARDVFLDWVQCPLNTVLITTRSAPGTLARFFVDNKQVRFLSLREN